MNAADSANGGEVYLVNCSVCRRETGEGLPGTFPSLKGDPVVNNTNSSDINAVRLQMSDCQEPAESCVVIVSKAKERAFCPQVKKVDAPQATGSAA